MRKKRLIILLSILVVVAIIGCFTFLYRAAAAEKDAFYKEYVTSNEVVERLSRLPEQIELESGSKPGYTVHFQDYSLTLPGYDDADIKNMNNSDYGSTYIIDNEKCLILMKCYGAILSSSILPQIEKAAGRKIDNVYEYWKASFYCTPDDFSMFDAEKNEGVYTLLVDKIYGCDLYQFDNGVIKGFIGSPAYVMFSNCDVPDSRYQFIFSDFSMEEVKEMLSTITFDGGNANQ